MGWWSVCWRSAQPSRRRSAWWEQRRSAHDECHYTGDRDGPTDPATGDKGPARTAGDGGGEADEHRRQAENHQPAGHPPADQTGFQYEPVASIATWLTRSATNQARSSRSAAVKVRYWRTSCSRPEPVAAGRRTTAITVSLCTSSPAHRSTSTSISRPSLRLEPGWPPVGPLRIETLTLVLVATVVGS